MLCPLLFSDIKRRKERRFIEQLVGGEPPLIDNTTLGLVPDLQLRPYQQSGIAWMVSLVCVCVYLHL